ncbi:unnamed protein product, partial [Adineta ricciae]
PLRGALVGITDQWSPVGVTVAGGNGNGSGLDQLDRPKGLYVDDDLTIYVADTRNSRVMEWKYNAISGSIVAGVNGWGRDDDQLFFPTDVIVDKRTDSLIICDRGNDRIVRWSRQNRTRRETIKLYGGCHGLTMHDDGSLYFSTGLHGTVMRQRIGEPYSTVIGEPYSTVIPRDYYRTYLDIVRSRSYFTYMSYCFTYIFVSHVHSVYASEIVKNQVQEGFTVRAGNRDGWDTSLSYMNRPAGVVVDQFHTVYVAESLGNRITRWPLSAAEGSIVVGGSGKGSRSNQLNQPEGLSFDRYGNLYVVDSLNSRVQRFDRIRSC